MEKSPSRELRQTADLHFRKHLVSHRRICNKCTAFHIDAFCSTGFIDHHSDVICKQCTKITCVHSFLSGYKCITHLLVDLIDSSTDRSYETTSCHCHIYGFQCYTLFREKIDYCITAHRSLVHHRLISSDLLSCVSKILLKNLLTGIIESYLA